MSFGVYGSRATDPWCGKLEHASHCTSGWPDIMRINPILHWQYRDVWQFLIKYDLAYCCLYDQGYTSLGDIKETIPNPLLYDRHLFRFRAASTLQKKYSNAERFGRLIRSKNESNNNLIKDVVKCLIVCADAEMNESLRDNVKMAIETSFVNGILMENAQRMNMNVDMQVIGKHECDEMLTWSKDNYLYTFYANISDK